MKDFLRTVGWRIKARRLELGLTQETLAEQTDLSPTYIAKLEGGHRSPSLETVLNIAIALGLDTADIVRLREEGDAEHPWSLAAIFDGLDAEDSEFARQSLLGLISHLRRRGR